MGIQAIAGKAKYLTAYGCDTGNRCKTFLEIFCLASAGMEEDLIKSAAQTFNLLHHWFNNTSINLIQHES